jgi:hypothetical protein
LKSHPGRAREVGLDGDVEAAFSAMLNAMLRAMLRAALSAVLRGL